MSKRMKSLCILAAFAIAYVSGWLILEFVEPFIAVAIFVAVAVSGGAVLRWRKIPMLGPLFWFDFVRLTRRRQHFLLRILYGLTLLFVLVLIFDQWSRQMQTSNPELWTNGAAAGSALALLGQRFSQSMIVVQNIAAVMLTPILAAGCIIEDRKRGVLDLLFVSHLHAREIVLGKMCARLAVMAILLMVGMPIIALVFTWGGVNMPLVVAGFAVAVISMVHAGAAATLCSVLFRSYATALFVCYFLLAVPACIFAAGGLWVLTSPFPFLMELDANLSGQAVVQSAGSVELWQTTVQWILAYLWFHLFFIGIYTFAAAGRLCQAPRQNHIPSNVSMPPPRAAVVGKPSYVARQTISKLPDDGNPLMWMEMANTQRMWYWSLFLVCWGASAFGCVFGLIMLLGLFTFEATDWTITIKLANMAIRFATVVIFACFVCAESLRTASSIVLQRERHVLDFMLMLPVERTQILLVKWLAGTWWFHWMLLALVVLWVTARTAAGLDPLETLMLMLAAFAHFLFFTSLGLTLSLFCRTTTQALILMLLVLLSVTFGAWLLLPENLSDIRVAVNPIQTWLELSRSSLIDDAIMGPWNQREQTESAGAYIGIPCYAALGGILWMWCFFRFKRGLVS